MSKQRYPCTNTRCPNDWHYSPECPNHSGLGVSLSEVQEALTNGAIPPPHVVDMSDESPAERAIGEAMAANREGIESDVLSNGVDLGVLTREDLEDAHNNGDISARAFEVANSRNPLSWDFRDDLSYHGWYDEREGKMFTTDEVVQSLADVGGHVDSEDTFVEGDGRTYVKVFRAPVVGMEDNTVDATLQANFANLAAIEDEETEIKIGEGHSRIRAEWPEQWLEVPVSDEYGKPTPDAVILLESLEDIRHGSLLNEDHYHESMNNHFSDDDEWD